MSVRWYGGRAKDAARRAGARFLESAGQELLDSAQDIVPVAPVRGGFLRDSGKVSVDADEMRACVSFDSPPPPQDGRHPGAGSLAIWVHEDLSAHHEAGKSAKFLEKPLTAMHSTGEFARAAAREMDKELR